VIEGVGFILTYLRGGPESTLSIFSDASRWPSIACHRHCQPSFNEKITTVMRRWQEVTVVINNGGERIIGDNRFERPFCHKIGL
jgi:hypothetical protein